MWLGWGGEIRENRMRSDPREKREEIEDMCIYFLFHM